MTPDGVTHGRGGTRDRVQAGENGDRAAPGDQQTDQHRDAHPDPDEMPDGE